MTERDRPASPGLDRIEQLATELVRTAPHCEPAAAGELVERLHQIDVPLARSIARVVALIAEQSQARIAHDDLARDAPIAADVPAADVLARVPIAVALPAHEVPAADVSPPIDLAGALPLVAMACATLADGVRGALGERELEAARYEIETLLPVPRANGPVIAAPDVPVSALRKRGP